MVGVNDLNNIHNRYGLALDTEDKAKGILVGDKLKWAEEQMEIVQEKLRFAELDFVFKHYTEVRNEIGKLDDDIISLQDAYIKEITEVAEKIAQENNLLKMRQAPVRRPRQEPEFDLGSDGKPQLVSDTLPEIEGQEGPLDSEISLVPEEGEGKEGLYRYNRHQRKAMVQKAYLLTQNGYRSTGQILMTWNRLFPDAPTTKTFIANNLKKLGLNLQGKLKRGKKALTSQ